MREKIEIDSFDLNIPMCGRWPYWKLVAGSLTEPKFLIKPGVQKCRIELSSENYLLTISRKSDDSFAFHILPDAREISLRQRVALKFHIDLVSGGENYQLVSYNGQRCMINSHGTPVALFETAWRDSDILQKVRYWIHCSSLLEIKLVAIFFAVCLIFDPYPLGDSE